MAMGSRAMDRMNRVRPPNGPWSVRVVRGTIPCTVHGPSGWSAMPALTWAFAWAA